MRDERGQGTVEWVGVVCVVCLLLVGVLATGVGVPGIDLARSVATRILCAVELADGCGDEPLLIATYGDEIGRLVRKHMPTIGFEDGSRAVPVDYRRCRETECGDAPEDGLVHRTDERLPVTSFVHVVDCRAAAQAASEAAGDDCSDERAGRLYLQYWLFYANSATEPFSSLFSSFRLEKSLEINLFARPATPAGPYFQVSNLTRVVLRLSRSGMRREGGLVPGGSGWQGVGVVVTALAPFAPFVGEAPELASKRNGDLEDGAHQQRGDEDDLDSDLETWVQFVERQKAHGIDFESRSTGLDGRPARRGGWL